VKGKEGFTLIEIMLVVTIIGLLAAIVVPRIVSRMGQVRPVVAQQQISLLEQAIDTYYLDTGRYPATLKDLIKNPGDVRNWDGPYLKRGIPKDPWGGDYVYVCPGKHNKDYDLYSPGPDGVEGTEDDITNWMEEE